MKKRRKVGVVESPSASEGGGGFLPVEADGTGGGFLTADDDVHGVGGGFVVEDNDMDGGGSGGSFISADNEAVVGGFIVDSPSSNADVEAIDDAADEPTPRTRTHLPLSLVSAALRLAGLPPSDPEVLEFLRQSAEGWADKDSDDEAEVRSDGRDSRRGVSRQDWMSVCAVLLASRAGEDEAESQFADSDDHRSSSLTEPDDDEYCDDADDVEADINNPAQRRTRQTIRSAARLSPVPSLPPDDSDDANSDADGFQQSVSDQIERTGRKTANAAKRSKASRGLLDTSSGRPELSRSEKRVAREAFALFFPSSARPAVDESILTVGMVAAAVKDLKETQISMDLVRRYCLVCKGRITARLTIPFTCDGRSRRWCNSTRARRARRA